MKHFLTILTLTLFSSKIFAQCAPSDSTIMGASYANDVFYSFKNGVVKTESNSNWQLAFSVQRSQFPNNPTNGVSIRVNTVKGCNLVKLGSSANAANWRSIDTTGLYLMPVRLDSMKTWDISAFTKEYNVSSAPFNFIWGNYNMTTKNVDGSSVFVLYNKTANWYKKVFIKQLGYDSMWNVIISNVDNTDSTNLIFSKTSYPNRLFVYYDVVNKQLVDREPTNASWDVVWTRYTEMATQGPTTIPYPFTGILSNKGVTVAKNVGLKCDKVWLGKTNATYSANTDAIGQNWKYSNMGPFFIVDTFVYFVKAKDAADYKLSFNSFVGNSAGKTVFSVKSESLSTSGVTTNNTIKIYPNPSNTVINIASAETIQEVLLTDVKGAMLAVKAINNSIDISDLANGIYVLQVTTANGTYTQKIIKE